MVVRGKQQAGYLELIGLGALWGSIGVLVDGVRVASPVIASIRMGLGCLAVAGYHTLRGRLRVLKLKEQRGLLLFDGVVLGVHWVWMFEAFKRLSVATAILIVFVGPVFVAVAAPKLLGERIERRTVVGLGLSVTGMLAIALPAWDVQDPVGVLYAIASALGFAALLIAGKRLTRTYPPPAILVWQLGIGTVAILPVALTSDWSGFADAAPSLVTLALVHTALAGLVYFAALTVVKAQHVGVLTYLEPATAIVYAWVFLSQQPSGWTLIGGALIVAGGLSIVIRRPDVAGSPAEPLAPHPDVQASLEP